jgi:hypothetical protein
MIFLESSRTTSSSENKNPEPGRLREINPFQRRVPGADDDHHQPDGGGSSGRNYIDPLPFTRSRGSAFMETAMSQIRQPSNLVDRGRVKSPAQSGPLEHAAVESAATEAGNRRSLNEGVIETVETPVEQFVAPAAIERALSIYQRLQEHERSVVMQARKILTRRIYAMVDQGESDEHRLTVGGLTHLKSVERDHAIKSASDSQNKKQR